MGGDCGLGDGLSINVQRVSLPLVQIIMSFC